MPDSCWRSVPQTAKIFVVMSANGSMIAWVIAGLVALAPGASADLIRLKNGGEVRGTLHRGHTRDPQVTIETLTGGRITVDRDEIVFTTVRPVEVELYELRARETPHTIEARWELAEWCRKNQLRSQRNEQLELLLLIDPDHEEANKALGHVRENGEWMSREEAMARRGYVRYQGKYVSQHELDLLQKSEAERAAELEWFGKVRVWVRWVEGSSRRRYEGQNHLLEITDPAAVPALTNFMQGHELVVVRKLLVGVLENIPGSRTVEPLVQLSLYDGSAAVRSAAIGALRADQFDAAIAMYLPALLSNDNPVVNRAAVALGAIGDPRTVPALIESLVTMHSYTVTVPANDAISVGVGPGGVGFGDPNVISQYLPPDIQARLLTGQLPFGVKMLPPPGIPRKMKAVKVHVQIENDSVLAALESITGRNFGFDERTWKLWWASRSRSGTTG